MGPIGDITNYDVKYIHLNFTEDEVFIPATQEKNTNLIQFKKRYQLCSLYFFDTQPPEKNSNLH